MSAGLPSLFAQTQTQYSFVNFAGNVGRTGSLDGQGLEARFYEPNAVTIDSDGNLYVADTRNCTIRKVTAAGVTTTVAGVAGRKGSVDGIGSLARFFQPKGVAVDKAGNVYVADTYNNEMDPEIRTRG